MRRAHLLAIFVGVALCSPGGAVPINFSPNYETSVQDGTPMRQLIFSSAGRRIAYRPRPKWQITGNVSALTIVPSDISEASAIIENAPEGLPPAFDATGLETYRKLVRGLLPNAAEKFENAEERIDPVTINDWHSWEYSCAYVLGGRRFAISILFVKLDPQREIRVVVDTKAADFKQFRKAVHGSLATWSEE
jgi:hypothetical protein